MVTLECDHGPSCGLRRMGLRASTATVLTQISCQTAKGSPYKKPKHRPRGKITGEYREAYTAYIRLFVALARQSPLVAALMRDN